MPFFYCICVCLILYSRSSTAIVPPVVPDDVDASQSSQPAVLIGALESANRRQCLFVSFVHSGSWRPACLQLQVGEPKRGRREPLPVIHLDNEMTFSNSGFRSLHSLMNGFWHETKSKTEWKKQATAPDRDLWQQTKSSVGSLLRLSIYRRRRPVEKLNWSSSANWGRRALLVNSRQQKQGERRAEQVERGHGSIWNKVFTVSRKTYRIFKPNDFGLAAIHSHNNTCNREQES